MAYSTLADCQLAAGGSEKLVQLTDYDRDGVSDAGVVDAAIADADAQINSYLQKRFAVPIAAPVPGTIVKLSARLAIYELRTQRQMVTESDVTRNERDIKWLEEVRDGANVPGVEPLPAKSSLQVDKAGTRDTTKLTSRERLKGFW